MDAEPSEHECVHIKQTIATPMPKIKTWHVYNGIYYAWEENTPRVEDIFDCVYGSKSGYHHVEMEEDHKPLATFTLGLQIFGNLINFCLVCRILQPRFNV